MVKKILTLILLLSCTTILWSQQQNASQAKVYNPAANAEKDLQNAKLKVAKSKKHVLVFVGGNWCPWCIRLDKFINENDSLKTMMSQNYEVVHINYSPENKNLALLKKLNNPQRFGFPVLLILDNKGNNIMTQNTTYLEEGKSYNAEKLSEFFKIWSYKAINTK